MYPKVSVIIPVYNGERFIAGAIESALAQTYENLELLIVNDGSTDRSGEKISPYLDLPNVRYIEQENKGVAAARNTGIRNAAGDLIAFLDQDDLWLPKKLELQVEYLLNHPDVPLVHANVDCIDDAGEAVNFHWDTGVEGMCFRELFARNRIAVLTVVVRIECLREVGLLNENLPGLDDYELWLRIARRFPIGHMEDVVALYRFHDLNVSRDCFDMTYRELKALQHVVDTFPDVYRTLGTRFVNNRLAHLNFQLGGWYMWKGRDFHLARRQFYQAIRLRPLHLPSYRRFLWCVLTPRERQAIDWYWQRLKNLTVSKPQPPGARSVN
jgi:glycosyltransferase involved in cell wall biosynthesis